ncbi:MerR family transcriptional regulator [Pseudoduganella sp. LjRoot289]|uniref:chaperone modulator CbpM n=1 Tax=Pseudoduganella sp. LjRoot289 TaxID=3342314 RepID=UPI003ECEB175
MHKDSLHKDSLIYGQLLEDAALTLEELARACAVEPDWVVRHVSSGALAGDGQQAPEAWRFASVDLSRARSLLRVERDFEADEQLAALVVDLCEEVQRLRSKLHSTRAR